MTDPAASARIRDDRSPRLLPLAIAAAAVGIWALLALGSAAPARAGLLEASCFPGTASRNGKQPCSACPAGSFASGSGATSCELCPIGSFAAGSGNATCQPCPNGTYADEQGSAICLRDQVSWPSEAASCEDPNDLEICIVQGIRNGGIVEIAADDVAAQDVFVTGKSFTLRPQPGFVPLFDAPTAITARGGDTDVEVRIEGLAIARGLLRLSQGGSGRFDATIRGNEIRRGAGAAAISVSSDLPADEGPTLFRLEDNRVTNDFSSQGFPASVNAIAATYNSTDTANELVIRGNEIDQRNTGFVPAIQIFSVESTLALDVIGNRIDGMDFNGGVTIVGHTSSELTGLVANNVVSGQVSSGGLSAAIGVRIDGESGDFAIVNNSVAFNDSGLAVDGSSESKSVSIANNVVAFNDFGLIAVGDGVENASNLVFGNGDDVFTPGPGTISADPLFASLDDLSLSATSPARDAGDSAHVPLDLIVDIEGNPRIVGPSVDIGAYEVPEPATGLGVAALAALAALRRRTRRHEADRRPADRRRISRLPIALASLLLLLPAAPATAGLFDIPCNPGTASRNGLQPCSACPAGTFASESGARTCEPCPIGTFAAQSGSATCQACASGTYADEEGSAICVRDQVSWPSEAAPCENPDDLEICIVQGIRDGGIVEIAVDDVASQDVFVTGKGFTLRPEPGRVPTFDAGTTIVARGSEADVEVVIEGLVIESGFIEARQVGPHRFEATIRNNEIQQSSAAAGAIGVNSSPPSNAGPTFYRVEDNRITIDRSQTFSSDVTAIQGSFAAPGGVNDLVIRGNSIEQRNTGQTGAIEIFNGQGVLTVDVIGNRIDGADFNNGVQIVESAGAATSGLVANNAVSGQVSAAGVTGAIGVRLDGGPSALAILNNSVAFNESGLRIGGNSESIDVLIANNLIAFNELGLLIQADGVANESNLVFDNGFDLFTPGPGTIAADPLFTAKGFVIDEQSPAHDAGNSAYVPLDLTVDIEGNPRIVGASVDIGAFEVPEPATGLGIVALAVLATLRRHTCAHANGRS